MNKGKNSSLNNKDRNELTRTMSNAILAGQFSEKHQMNPKHKTHGSSFASGHKVYNIYDICRRQNGKRQMPRRQICRRQINDGKWRQMIEKN